jgi:hypothetical protein
MLTVFDTYLVSLSYRIMTVAFLMQALINHRKHMPYLI